jgi:hypothetical protein
VRVIVTAAREKRDEAGDQEDMRANDDDSVEVENVAFSSEACGRAKLEPPPPPPPPPLRYCRTYV